MDGIPGGEFDFNAYFPVKVCINLDRRPDRWEKMVRAFERHRIEGVIRFPAVDGRQIERPADSPLCAGELGCLRSHLAVVKRHRDAPRLLILEDDCLFVPDFRERFSRCAAELPADWHLLFFGDQRLDRPDREHISRNVVRARSIWLTHIYAINQCVYDAFIAFCETGRAPSDGCTIEMQQIFDCYCFIPRLAWQDFGDSDIGH